MTELAIFAVGMILGTIVTIGIAVLGSRVNDSGERRKVGIKGQNLIRPRVPGIGIDMSSGIRGHGRSYR